MYYYFADHLGSTRLVTNASGSPCYKADFLPYGTENTPAGFTNTCSPRYKFTGFERDAETAYGTSNGNDYAFARYFNSRMGRFMTADPLGGHLGDPQSLNLYAYVRNNPTNMTDPTGMDCFLGGIGCDPGGPLPPPDPCDWFFFCADPSDYMDCGSGPVHPPWIGPVLPTPPVGPGDGRFTDPLAAANPFTAQVGVSVGWTWWGWTFSGFTGFIIDTHGHLGTFWGGGTGVGVGAKASGGFTASLSNADTICGMGGPFDQVSVGGGAGAAGTVDVFTGVDKKTGKRVTGAGGTIGAGVGASASAQRTGTRVQSRSKRVSCE